MGCSLIGFPAGLVPWISLLLSLISLVVLLSLWRAFAESTIYKGRLSASIAAVLSLLFVAVSMRLASEAVGLGPFANRTGGSNKIGWSCCHGLRMMYEEVL